MCYGAAILAATCAATLVLVQEGQLLPEPELVKVATDAARRYRLPRRQVKPLAEAFRRAASGHGEDLRRLGRLSEH